MDDQDLIRLNTVLQEVTENHDIISFDKIRTWFESESAEQQVEDVTELFNEALEAGYVHQWVEPDEDQMRWDWTPDAVKKAKELGICLVSPLGISHLFKTPCRCVTSPANATLAISVCQLAEEPYQHCEAVFERGVRFVVTHEEKPVAALVPLTDLELVKDLFSQLNPTEGLARNQEVRKRLGWPAAEQHPSK